MTWLLNQLVHFNVIIKIIICTRIRTSFENLQSNAESPLCDPICAAMIAMTSGIAFVHASRESLFESTVFIPLFNMHIERHDHFGKKCLFSYNQPRPRFSDPHRYDPLFYLNIMSIFLTHHSISNKLSINTHHG